VSEEIAHENAQRLERAVALLASVGLGGAAEYQRGIAKLGADAKAEVAPRVFNGMIQDLHRLDCVALVNIPSASAARNVQWGTWTSTIGWPVKGFWNRSPEDTCEPDNSDVDLVPGRVPLTVGGSGGGGEVTVISCDRPRSYKMVPVLACGNDRGGVRLFNYPCYDSRAAYKQYHAHTSQVSTVLPFFIIPHKSFSFSLFSMSLPRTHHKTFKKKKKGDESAIHECR
jgi:hypothetical protein